MTLESLMSRHFSQTPDHLREPHQIEIVGGGHLIFIALGITLLIGLVSGLAWIGWNLLRLHVLR
jgi:hypothetical protein